MKKRATAAEQTVETQEDLVTAAAGQSSGANTSGMDADGTNDTGTDAVGMNASSANASGTNTAGTNDTNPSGTNASDTNTADADAAGSSVQDEGKKQRKGRRSRKKVRKHKSRRAYLAGHIPTTILLVILLVAANVLISSSTPMINAFVGRGKASYKDKDGKQVDAVSYYTMETADKNEARQNAEAVAEQVSDEGEVLLKNDGVLPLAKGSKVTPFGYAYLNPAYTGTGAGASSTAHNVSPADALGTYFTVDNATVDIMNSKDTEYVSILEADGTTPAVGAAGALSSDSGIYEYDPVVFQGIENEIADTDALVFITRQGNEGSDKKMDAYSDGTPHYLALSSVEKGLIAYAKANCRSVTVILVSSNPMELLPLMSGEYEVDAILWIGNPGARGFVSMAKILCGEVDPSGRLVDTYAADFTKDPTYQNMGVFEYDNCYIGGGDGSDGAQKGKYIEYQEGLYSGYRYYETADLADPDFDYETAVCYPFGYGLSYTSFTQELADVRVEGGTKVQSQTDDKTKGGRQIQIDVTVTNTGTVAGKDVVQIYSSSPYTAYDQQMQIEKPVVVLVAFDKTQLLQPGEAQTITLSVDEDDLASYCYNHENSDGTKGCYVLEAGTYTISLRENSHDVIDAEDVDVPETIYYEGANKRETDTIAATNQFQDDTDYMNTDSTILTRSDWAGTQPVMAEGRTKPASAAVKEAYDASFHFDINTDALLGNEQGSKVYSDEMPAQNEDNDLVLSELRGLDYDDPMWDQLLDQIDYDSKELRRLLFTAGYQTGELDSIGKPLTTDQDGDTGLRVSGADPCAWMSKPVMASTWNQDLLYEVGTAFGQEALTNGQQGWYAPAMNIHRSPFGGRALEYFSEDPLLSGKLAARMVSGCGDQGLICYIKHFAVNDQETNRQNYLNTWVDEQTIREIYLKPFEITIKEASMTVNYEKDGQIVTTVMPATLGVMSAQSCLGTTICFAHYGLLTGVLRNEWGFHGAVLTDLFFNTDSTLRDRMLRAGNDMYLMQNTGLLETDASDMTSATARTAIRNALHHIAYATANSAAMEGIGAGDVRTYGPAAWQVLVVVLDIIFILLLVRRVRKMVRYR